MPDVTRRRQGELLRTLFDVLRAHPEGLPARQAIEQVASRVTLTPYEAGEYASGTRRFEKILRFATIVCVKAGWLVKDKGRWYLTDAGRSALDDYRDPEAFIRRAIDLYRVWKKGQPDVEDAAEEDVESERTASITYEQAEEQAWGEIEKHLRAMPPYEFQELVASLLRAMGYHVGWVAPPGKDGGVDIVLYGDPLGTRPPRIKVQVKRQEQRVDVGGLRSFMAVLGAEDVGIYVNAGGFTKDAESEARTQQIRHVTLLDLERLVDLWVEHYPRLDESAKRRLPLQPIYFLAPEG